ncbi:tRNA uridine(34) 5-carboxymethylaminomethyl modification radical SAM/GNAT enzyme Elp3 [Candidatus Micrarchaeota archaeon]|nr:tRNA uridine(34) 5-carboxymethylaminomethyl modification radical SAM/GNAT enzyme Elp3 [Candidatus Micrarchaeota archaeon]
MTRLEAIDSIVRRILAGDAARHSLDWVKRQECRRYRISDMIRNPEILARFPEERLNPELKTLLRKCPTRTVSGVTPVAVMIRPQGSCRHDCIYCPESGLAAKSYSGFEPAALRSRQCGFDPYLQSSGRVAQLEGGGHPADKCEVIIMGGTFLEMDAEYKRSFVKGVYDGLNGFRAGTLEEAIRANEKAKTHRAVGLTVETRPDACVRHIAEMLSYGATRVELGVQHADDGIYRRIRRGHTVRHVVESTRALKDAAFKVLYHIMPGLPESGREKDIRAVKKLFAGGRFQPDMLKIYPTLVLEGTGLKALADAGEYEPYDAEMAADVISEFYRHIPGYVRVMRIQRDIPARLIWRGVRKSNLRELVEAAIREKGIVPKEIRCREIGLQGGKPPPLSEFDIVRTDYEASGGRETFLSYENRDGLLAGFIRLRLPSEKSAGIRSSIRPDAALVRELHVYGSEVPISGRGDVQHHGLGARLLKAAEDAAKEDGRGNMLIISGVGVREYYRKHGYAQDGYYMGKAL